MLGVLDSLAGFIKIRYVADKPIIDNNISRLHYRFTTVILFMGCLLCTANSLIGNPIECLHNNANLQKTLNTYCWIMSTFTFPGNLENEKVGVHMAHPGVRPIKPGVDDEIVYHSYYQWVPFVLFFQGLLFYAPHWFWKNWEDGKIRLLSEGIRGTLAETREGRKERQSKIVQYIINTTDIHSWYAFGYYLSEIMNFINVIGNIFFTDKFLGGKFLTYGIKTLTQRRGDTSAFIETFPRITKCIFHMFGPSGSIQRHDAVCVLALNILNEKIYILLWWWFIMLTIVSGLALIYSTSIIVSPTMRRNILFRRFKFTISEGARTIVSNTKIGDFFLLHLLGQNINVVVYTEILEELSSTLARNATNVPQDVSAFYPSKDNLHRQ